MSGDRLRQEPENNQMGTVPEGFLWVHFVSILCTPARTLSKLVACALVLSSCLNSEGPKRPESTVRPKLENGSNPITATSDYEPTSSERSKGIEDLASIVYSARPQAPTDNLLIDLLIEMNEQNEMPPLSMQDMRMLQESYLEWYKKAPDSTPPSAPPETPSQLSIKRTGCVRPTDEFKTYKKNIRNYTKRSRRQVNECYFDNSRSFEHAFNLLLLEKEITLNIDNTVVKTSSFKELISALSKLGFEVKGYYHTYFAPFFRLYQEETAGGEREVPLPLWLDAGFELASGTRAIVPAIHSEILIEIRSANFGLAALKIYYSDKGLVFDDEELELPEWVGSRSLQSFNPSELGDLLNKAIPIKKAFEIFKNAAPAGIKAQGFGLLGVCNDGAGLIARSFLGPDFKLPFPLVRSDLIKMPDEFPASDIWNALISDTHDSKMNLSNEEKLQQIGPRLLQSYPFTKNQVSRFPNYELFISELRETLNATQTTPNRQPQSQKTRRARAFKTKRVLSSAESNFSSTGSSSLSSPSPTLQSSKQVLSAQHPNSRKKLPFELSLDFESYRFVTPFGSTQNAAWATRFKLRSGNDNYEAAMALRLSNEPGQKLLGNIAELRYGDPKDFALGRFAPSESKLGAFAIHDRLNHKICSHALDCDRGGPIGISLGLGRSSGPQVNLVVALLSPPNLEPRPSFNKNGAMTTRNRYAVPRIDTVDLGGQEFDLRVSSQFAEGDKILFKPGLRLDTDWSARSDWSFKAFHSLEMSKFPTASSSNGLRFEENTNGELRVVAGADVTLDFPYEFLQSYQLRFAEHDTLGSDFEISHSFRQKRHAGSLFLGPRLKLNGLSLGAGVGALVEKQTDPIVRIKAASVFGRFQMATDFYSLLKTSRQGVYLAPLLRYRLDKNLSMWTQAELIYADEKAPLLASMRANDRIRIGLSYDGF